MRPQTAHGPAWDAGRPGASARAEYERLRQREAAAREARFGRVLGAVVGAVSGPNPRTVAWARGSAGEESVGRLLTRVVGNAGIVLHDRAVPGGRANIDHIAVVPSGIWVVDTKRYRGRVRQRGGWFGSGSSLLVNRHNRTNLVASALKQRQLVQQALEAKVPVRVALCFTDAEWGMFAKPFTLNGVMVSWPRRLAVSLRAPGPLTKRDLRLLAERIDQAFPAYAPSGTSHNPTGA